MEENNLTPEQYERYIQTVDEFQQLRTLSREEKIKIIDDILKAPFLDLRSDWAFKYVFGGHPDLLKMLLNDFLPEPVESVTVLPNELPHNRPDDKNIILDVLCRLGDGREIIVEMQRKGHDSFRNRMFYYGADGNTTTACARFTLYASWTSPSNTDSHLKERSCSSMNSVNGIPGRDIRT